MKYLIKIKTNKYLKRVISDNGTKQFEIKEKTEYYAVRKGRIFGFNHSVIMWSYDMHGEIFREDYFDSLEECVDFAMKYHEVKYSKNSKPEILMKFTL